MTQKGYQQGTHRQCSPQSTLDRISPWLLQMGITRVANVTGLDRIGVPVVTVCRPDSSSVSVSQGKGLDLISAKVSGVMEAIETYHGEHIEHPLRLASYAELCKKEHVIDVHHLPRLSFSQFSDTRKLLWIEGHDLIQGHSLFVPYEVVHCNFSLPLPTGSGSFVMSTNGLASGNTYHEAVVHGLCEVIERDALALWQLERNQDSNHQIKLDTVNDPSCLSVIAKFQQAQMQVQVWDITSDIDIPSFLCKIRPAQNANGPAYAAIGSGTHPCKNIALLRALTEAAQTRLTLISGSRDDIDTNSYTRRANLQASVPDDGQKDFADIQSWHHGNFEQDISLLLDKLQQVGVSQVAVINLEKNEFQIPVVRVLVPRLEGIHETPGYVMGQRARAKQQAIIDKDNA
ncbi:YcaO-like family protein [Photobacterium sp. MCCC 1A19761]|uniref:YcaO-like family protein n=1 Tax=Photobacterium sp. MCCC 1A19761 TaxID=3115000 RepID=UPI00307D6084